MGIVSAERTVEVLLRVEDEEHCSPPDIRGPLSVSVVKIIYAGSGYVRVEVRGRIVKRDGTLGGQASGHWSHMEGAPAQPHNRYDTSHAPDWVREYATRYAPPDFTAVS